MTKRKIAIIGAGPAGLFTALGLIIEGINKNIDIEKQYNIVVFDKGKNIYNRICPIRNNPELSCVHCNPCNIMNGFGGAGTFSDCKLSLSPLDVGGNVVDYIGKRKAKQLAKIVELYYSIFDEDYKNRQVFGDSSIDENIKKIKEQCEYYGIKFTENPTKHLGTDGTYKVMLNLYNYLISKGVTFIFSVDASVVNYNTDTKQYAIKYYNYQTLKDPVYFLNVDSIVYAPGRSGNNWLKKEVERFNIETKQNKFDIGVRVETKKEYVQNLTDYLYDMKLSYIDTLTGNKIRTFCTNPGGFVSEEHYSYCGYSNIAVANGHSFADKKSDNTNFALLVTLNDNQVTSDIILKLLANRKNSDKIVYQNFLNIIQCTYADYMPITDIDTKRTLESAIPGNLSDILPKDVIFLIYHFMSKYLDKICPGIANQNTFIYAPEVKFYSDLIVVDNNFKTTMPNMYCIGDGSGITHGIIQSSICGLVVAENIIKTLFEK